MLEVEITGTNVKELMDKGIYGWGSSNLWIEEDYEILCDPDLGDPEYLYMEQFNTCLVGERKFIEIAKCRYHMIDGKKVFNGNYQPVDDTTRELWNRTLDLPIITGEELKELKVVDAMTNEEYRLAKCERLEKESKPDSFEFTCELKGKTLQFKIDNKDRVDLLGQMAMGQEEFEVHDVQRVNSETFSKEEVGVIMGTLAYVTRQHKYPIDERIKALYGLPKGFTKEDVNAI